MRETAYAKINLALHVRQRRADGYHMIETLFAFAEEGDELELEQSLPDRAHSSSSRRKSGSTDMVGGKSELAESMDPGFRRGNVSCKPDRMPLSLRLSGPFSAGLGTEDNLVVRAAEAFFASFGIAPAGAIRLDKRLPVASGIGGGSADAAAALRLLARAYEVPLDDARLGEIAARLGADVPACLLSLPTRGEERGDRLTPVPGEGLAGTPLLLVNPGVPLSTAEVFRGWDGVDRGALGEGDPVASAKGGRNDLEAPAVALRPVIGDVLALLGEQPGASFVRMSGSGATCFALFDSEAARDAADRAIARGQPEWWRLATRLR